MSDQSGLRSTPSWFGGQTSCEQLVDSEQVVANRNRWTAAASNLTGRSRGPGGLGVIDHDDMIDYINHMRMINTTVGRSKKIIGLQHSKSVPGLGTHSSLLLQNTYAGTGAAKHRERDAFALTIVSALSGDRIFGPLRIQRHENVNCLLRRLQHLSHLNPEMSGKQIQLLHNDRILDPSMPVLFSRLQHLLASCKATDWEHELEFTMIVKPVLLTWEQLVAMPAMRKRAGRGGKNACVQQRRLRVLCFENHMREVDLSNSDYDWRLLLKTMSSAVTKDGTNACVQQRRLRVVIGVGVTRFTFRLLDTIDCNYAPGSYADHRHGGYTGERHVFELSCANGDRWHLHFHQHGSCDLEHLAFNDLEA